MLLDLKDWAAGQSWPVAIMTVDTCYANQAFDTFFAMATAEMPLHFHWPDGRHAIFSATDDPSVFVRGLFYQLGHRKQFCQASSGTARYLVSVTSMIEDSVLVEICAAATWQQNDIDLEKMKLAI